MSFQQWSVSFVQKGAFYHVPYTTKSGKAGLVKVSRIAIANGCAKGFTFDESVQQALRDHIAMVKAKTPKPRPLPRTDLPKIEGPGYKTWELPNPTEGELRKIKSITKNFSFQEGILVVSDLSYRIISKLQEHLPRGVFKGYSILDLTF